MDSVSSYYGTYLCEVKGMLNRYVIDAIDAIDARIGEGVQLQVSNLNNFKLDTYHWIPTCLRADYATNRRAHAEPIKINNFVIGTIKQRIMLIIDLRVLRHTIPAS